MARLLPLETQQTCRFCQLRRIVRAMKQLALDAVKAVLKMASSLLQSLGRLGIALLWSGLLRVACVGALLLIVAGFVYGVARVSAHWGWEVACCLGMTLLFIVAFKQRRLTGKIGEWLVRATLAVWFPRSIRLHDVYLLHGDRVTQIDHILICSRGIFVIETKCWSGRYRIKEITESWQFKTRRRGWVHKYNPLRQNEGHIAAVHYVLGSSDDIRGIVAMVGWAWLHGSVRGVTDGLNGLLRHIWRQPEVMDSLIADLIGEQLRVAQLPRNEVTKEKHRRSLAQATR
ncbi:MAG: NERD domain-containing protein [Nitrospira sp.]|nr:NERD domain-containing protein [Nitrospira sp.]